MLELDYMDCTIVDILNERGSYLHNRACERLQLLLSFLFTKNPSLLKRFSDYRREDDLHDDNRALLNTRIIYKSRDLVRLRSEM